MESAMSSAPSAKQASVTTLAAAAAVAMAVTTWAVLSGQASGKAPVAPTSLIRYEYAEFRIDEDTSRALLSGERTLHEIRVPDQNPNLDRNIVVENSLGRFTKTFNLLVHYQIVLGSEGWEFNLDAPIKRGQTSVVRRRLN